MHLHTDAGVGVSAQAEGLLPISQNHLIVLPLLAYHGYEGVALNHDERERLVADLGDKSLMMLRNHGTLGVGATAAEAWTLMFFLERACAQQIAALSAGRAGILIAPEAAQMTVRDQTSQRSGHGRRRALGLARPVAQARPRTAGLRQLGSAPPGASAGAAVRSWRAHARRRRLSFRRRRELPRLRRCGVLPRRACVRARRLFRSAHLASASDADLDRLAALGVRTLTDLRRLNERRSQPSRWTAFPGRLIQSDEGGPGGGTACGVPPPGRPQRRGR